jgi:hypothetical protein
MVILTMMLALAQAPTHLTVEPWTGTDFQVTSAGAAKYRLKVNGKPNATVSLRALGVARGWLAAFCTPKLCSPERVNVALPRSGEAVFQFELIREAENAPKESGATIADNNGVSVKVPAAYRQ